MFKTLQSKWKGKRGRYRIGIFFLLSFFLIFILLLIFGIWSASNQILFPKWKGITKDLGDCNREVERVWGKKCGNIRLTKEYFFSEISVPSINGYQLPGWKVIRSENEKNFGTKKSKVIILVHGGGSDRREVTRYISFYLSLGMDVISFDLSCHGEAPCHFPGLSFGSRESRDVLSILVYVKKQYKEIYMFGSSVGGASILINLPIISGVNAIIVENPMISFERLISDSKEAKELPNFMIDLLVNLVLLRGNFDTMLSPENSMKISNGIPILLIHSQQDQIVSYHHSEYLSELYLGPVELWFPSYGEHGLIWNSNPAAYEDKIREFIGSYQNKRGE
ncbi:alpha/beta hydrolase [Leptospira levettii]|uniref:alpha/beta hydrolase n=1 Tax=Leptospira levettii TaxID=2023178 RepID=UPI001FEE28EB|nr:alpha/beta hydrolase [Leptospira levettii]MCW7508352.1 alpha/beta hydrolase [Leptospira levettii]MCW7519442.1 alpha/beta hydrolase [Leptospira levettii]